MGCSSFRWDIWLIYLRCLIPMAGVALIPLEVPGSVLYVDLGSWLVGSLLSWR